MIAKHTILHEGTCQPQQEQTYVHLPFDVPANATRLDVTYSYSNQIGSSPLLTGGNTIDLGVFDARGIDFLKAGFRGWSGSERSSFYITETEATPGYLAGPLAPGRWYVFLGLYKLAPEGCSYRVEVTITTDPDHSNGDDPPDPTGDLPASNPRALNAPWLAGELHCHSWHSDGDRSAADVVKLARARGLDFLAVSDHNTTASQRELARLSDPGLVLIRGVEVTTFKGHFNVWGIPHWVDFRIQQPEQMAAALHFANERGAVTSCGHPKPYGPMWEYESVTDFRCVEVWNGPWTVLNQMSLEYWLSLLATGRRITAMGGSDWHRQHHLEEDPPRAPGTPTVWVHVPGTASSSAILDGIRRGHVSLSDEPHGAFLDLRAGPSTPPGSSPLPSGDGTVLAGDVITRPTQGKLLTQVRCLRAAGYQLQLLDQQRVLYQHVITSDDVTLQAELPVSDSLYVRAELRSEHERLRAMTNPVYITEKQPNSFGAVR